MSFRGMEKFYAIVVLIGDVKFPMAEAEGVVVVSRSLFVLANV